MFSVRKKSQLIKPLAYLIIGALSFIAFMLVTSELIAKTDEGSAEKICRAFNIARMHTKKDFPIFGQVGTPRACATISKLDKDKAFPSQDYLDKFDAQEATINEIRYHLKNCWWMWNDGTEKNTFDGRWWQWEGDPGFICYKFFIKPEAKGGKIKIKLKDLHSALIEPRYAVDGSDRCAPLGGGECMDECEGDTEKERFSKEVSSNACPISDSGEQQKCCVVEDNNYECVNKGGICYDGLCESLEDEKGNLDYTEYDGWKCGRRGESCCVHKEYMVTYMDYIQGTGGSESGPGAFVYSDSSLSGKIDTTDPEAYLEGGEIYAISFVSPGKDADIYSYLGSAGTGLGVSGIIGAAFFCAAATPVCVGIGIAGGGLAIGSFLGWEKSGSVTDINFLVLSPYEDVQGKYAESIGWSNERVS